MRELTNVDQCQVQIPGINYPSLQSTQSELFTKKSFLQKESTIFPLELVIKILQHSEEFFTQFNINRLIFPCC